MSYPRQSLGEWVLLLSRDAIGVFSTTPADRAAREHKKPKEHEGDIYTNHRRSPRDIQKPGMEKTKEWRKNCDRLDYSTTDLSKNTEKISGEPKWFVILLKDTS